MMFLSEKQKLKALDAPLGFEHGVLYPSIPAKASHRRDWRWPHFEPEEFQCRGSGEFFWHDATFDAVESARQAIGKPLIVNSAHRSWLYNIAVGGVPRSAHLWLALDISTRNHDRGELHEALRLAGFQSFGYYTNFIHVDMRPSRRWYGSAAAKDIWLRSTKIQEG